MIKQLLFIASASTLLVSSTFAQIPFLSKKANCDSIHSTVIKAVRVAPARVLEITSTNISQNPNCACEIVKASIQAADASKSLVASIVETAIIAAPDQMKLIGQCAIAVAPDAASEVQAVMNKYTAQANSTYSDSSNSSEDGYSSKDSYSSKDQAGGDSASPSQDISPNPLDFPGSTSQINNSSLGGGGDGIPISQGPIVSVPTPVTPVTPPRPVTPAVIPTP